MLPDERPIRLQEAAALVHLSPRTFYAMMYTGELKGIAHRQGPRLIFFYPSELFEYMANRKYIPLSEAIAKRKAAGTYKPLPPDRSRKRKARTEAK